MRSFTEDVNMFEYINGEYYCSEYNFTAIQETTYEDIILMIERGEIDNE